MSEQQFERKPENDERVPDIARTAKLDIPDISALLSQIDSVLEKNAEEFVKGFVQKGGQ